MSGSDEEERRAVELALGGAASGDGGSALGALLEEHRPRLERMVADATARGVDAHFTCNFSIMTERRSSNALSMASMGARSPVSAAIAACWTGALVAVSVCRFDRSIEEAASLVVNRTKSLG